MRKIQGRLFGMVLVSWLGVSAGWSATLRTWTGAEDHHWFNAANWDAADSSVQYPQSGDTVMISGGTVLLDAETEALAAFTITNATLTFTNWTSALRAEHVTLENGGTFTLPGAFSNAPAMSNRIWVICDNFTMRTGSIIQADAFGYQKFTGPGHGGFGSAVGNHGGGGGGHGGRGARGNIAAAWGGPQHGVPEMPMDPGSGSGGYSPTHAQGASGGGAVRIEATATVTIHGTITANGGNSSGSYGGGAAGGAIFITCATFGGNGGILLANGGNGGSLGGGGGGGRIAVVYDDLLPAPSLLFSVGRGSAGPIADDNMPDYPTASQVGTLYFPDTTLMDAILTANSGVASEMNGYVIFAETNIWQPSGLSAMTNSMLGVPAANRWQISSHLTVHAGGLVIDPHGELFCDGDLTLTNSALLMAYGGDTNGVTEVNYGALVDVTGSLTLNTGCWIYPFSNSTNGGSVLFRVGALTIADGAGINADYRGFASRQGPGKGGNSFTVPGGGGHGGRGGATAGGSVNGDPLMPNAPGSGAGQYSESHGQRVHGGGFVWISSPGHVAVNGIISADGQNGLTWTGGGSGGAIFIACGSFSGGATAALRARGGNGGTADRGGGGGGRILVTYGDVYTSELPANRLLISDSSPETFTGTTSVLAGSNGTPAAENGTVFFIRVLRPRGTLFSFR